MKKNIFITIGLFCFSLTALSQTVTLDEMINKVKCSDYNCFNDYIIKKGFSEKKVAPYSSEIKFFYAYRSDSTFTSTLNPKVSSKRNEVRLTCMYGINQFSFRTVVKKQYQSLIDQLSTLKFKSTKTTDKEDGTKEIEYMSTIYPNIIVQIHTSTSYQKSDNESFTIYLFDVNWKL